MMTLLTDEVLDWAQAVQDNDNQLQTSFDYFTQQIQDVFEYPEGGQDISVQLLYIHQSNRSATEYAIQIRMLATHNGWYDVALKTVFREGLNHELEAEMACKNETPDLSQFITMAIKLNNLIRNKLHTK